MFLSETSNNISKFFGDVLKDIEGSPLFSAIQSPFANIEENSTNYELQLVTPGFNKSDFKIEAINEVLTISGRRADVKKLNSFEKIYGEFTRQYELPPDVDIHKIEAEYLNGILTVRIPRDNKQQSKRIIEIK